MSSQNCNNLILYYSINDLIKDSDINNLIQNNTKNSNNEYKTTLWGDNNIIFGEIIFRLEIKYDTNMNYYSHGNVIIYINNNHIETTPTNEGCYIETIITNEGCYINLLTDKYDVLSNDKNNNINIEHFVNDNNLLYGIIKIKSI